MKSQIAVNTNREMITICASLTARKTSFLPFPRIRTLISQLYVINDYNTFAKHWRTGYICSEQIDNILQIGDKIKSSGNLYFKKEDFINANRKYKKALRYLNKLHDNDLNEETEKKVLSQELPCLLNRYSLIEM